MVQNPIHLVRAAIGFARVVHDPDRLGEVFQFIDHTLATSATVVQPALDAFRATPEGARALRERTRVGKLSLDALARLPEGTLGHAFAAHMRKNGLDPDALPTREAASDAEYVSAHLYETHDIWHVLTGFGSDRAGELGLQAFYLAQFPSRIATGILTMGFANTLFFEFEDVDPRMDAIVRGWMLGRRAESVLGVDWKTLWSTPLAEVRARYGVRVDAADHAVAELRPARRGRAAGEAVLSAASA